MDDDYDEYDAESAPLSPASSDGESSCSSDEEGSLASSCSSIEDLEEDDFLEDIPEAKTPPPQAPRDWGARHLRSRGATAQDGAVPRAATTTTT